MKLPAPYQCDVCGKIKGESNHWWLVIKNLFTTFEGVKVANLLILQWEQKLVDSNSYYHLCSQSCVHKKVDEFMEGIRNANSKEVPNSQC